MNIATKLATALIIGSLALTGCSVDQTEQAKAPSVDVSGDAGNMPEYEVRQTEEGEAPSADVDVKGGQLPEYDVETAEVEVSTEEETVKVPEPRVVIDEETVTTPEVDVEMPGENENETN